MHDPEFENYADPSRNDIFSRLILNEPIRADDPEYPKIMEVVDRTIVLSSRLNSAADTAQVRAMLSEILEYELDESTTVFPPFYTNFGKFIKIGKRVFINHACSFLDLGGITLEDDVMLGPRVNLITENHPVDPARRKDLLTQPILIKRNAWLGAGVTVLPGVIIGENAVVAAGAVVSKNVAPNTVVGGIPAKLIKEIT